jgi:hypothetical protein
MANLQPPPPANGASPNLPPANTPGGNGAHYPPSPRMRLSPDDRTMSASRPALRISRARAGSTASRYSRMEDDLIPPGSDPAPANASPPDNNNNNDGSSRWWNRRRSRSVSQSPRIPDASVSPRVPPTAAGRGVAPIQIPRVPEPAAMLVRDARGNAQLTPVPEVVVTSPSGSTHGGTHPSPHRSIPIPPNEPIRSRTVLATELPQPATASGGAGNGNEGHSPLMKKLWPFGKKKGQDEDATVPLEPGVQPRDYAVGAGDPQQQGQLDHQYAEDIVDWLDVIGASLKSFLFSHLCV